MEINNVTAVRSDINEMLSKIREMSAKTSVFGGIGGISHPVSPTGMSPTKSFDETFSGIKEVFNKVNEIQTNTDKVKDAYVSGDKHVSMAQVLLTSEKSRLAFEGLISVRNKILEAYKEIMNMPV